MRATSTSWTGSRISSGMSQTGHLPSLRLEVPDRVLRLCCNEYLGMGPHRYLHLRQLHFARRALRYSLPGVARISDVARRYGFGGPSRFAAAYREQFGELPSVTIRRH